MSLESSLTTRKCTVCWAHKGQVRWSSSLEEPESCREAEVTEEQEQHQCPKDCLSLKEKRRRRTGDTGMKRWSDREGFAHVWVGS